MSVTVTSHNTQIDQYAYVAQYIKHLIEEDGVNEHEIAVIARKHKFLESLSFILNEEGISINYERKEDILKDPNIVWLTAYLKLVVNLSKNRHDEVDYLIPEILSHEFWQLHPFIIYDISLQAYRNKKYWLEIMKSYTTSVFDDENVNQDVAKRIREIAQTFQFLSAQSRVEPVEVILDYILGNKPVILDPELSTETIMDIVDEYEADNSYSLS